MTVGYRRTLLNSHWDSSIHLYFALASNFGMASLHPFLITLYFAITFYIGDTSVGILTCFDIAKPKNNFHSWGLKGSESNDEVIIAGKHELGILS